MAKDFHHVRQGIGTVRPYVYGSLALLDFVKQTFGDVELERHEFYPKSVHAEFLIGDSVLVIEAGELPADVSPWVSAIYVYVEDVDEVFSRALKLGATPLAQPEDKPYQERQAGIHDMVGNTWWVATYKQSR